MSESDYLTLLDGWREGNLQRETRHLHAVTAGPVIPAVD
jgi:hypothetical protein